MLIKSIRFNSLILGVCALITAALLAGTHLGTKERIAQEQRRVAQKALLEIIPAERHSNDMLMDTVAIPPRFLSTLGIDDGEIHIARNQGQAIAVIVPATAPDGYNGDISMIVGINLKDSSIAGVRIIQHSETPGLGDKVDTNKSDWVLAFNGKSLANPSLAQWKVKKDGGQFDQFTGATITPRAVVQQIARVLQYFKEDRQRLLKATEKNATAKPAAAPAAAPAAVKEPPTSESTSNG